MLGWTANRTWVNNVERDRKMMIFFHLWAVEVKILLWLWRILFCQLANLDTFTAVRAGDVTTRNWTTRQLPMAMELLFRIYFLLVQCLVVRSDRRGFKKSRGNFVIRYRQQAE